VKWRLLSLIVVLVGAFAVTSPAMAAGEELTIEWQVDGVSIFAPPRGTLGKTGVTVEVRETAVPHGRRYDVRLRNRTGAGGLLRRGAGTEYRQTALRVHVRRAGTASEATIEGVAVAVPAQVHQWWEAGPLVGIKYGFAYAIKSGDSLIKRIGPSTQPSRWGGRTNGIVRVDGRAYVVPEFWERYPRRIAVTADEVVLTLFEGGAPLRAGEDVWDRFAILDAALDDAAVAAEADDLPKLAGPERKTLQDRFGITPEGLKGRDGGATMLLRKYDQWQGTSWDPKYADANPARTESEFAPDGRTTLFTLLAKGNYYPVNRVEDYAPTGGYGWRDFGDIQWGAGLSAGHYDWVRSALKHYLKTGDLAALRWGLAAARHAVSVDFVWTDYHRPGDAGWARYEKGNHGGPQGPPNYVQMPMPSHTWVEGLFLAAAITGDPWIREAAVRRVEGAWNYWNGASPAVWDGSYGELRSFTWPMLMLIRGFIETGDLRYWTKTRELMGEFKRHEQLAGGKGYILNLSSLGGKNYATPLQQGYAVRPLVEFADLAKARGEWTAADQELFRRIATWITTPIPSGPYTRPTAERPGLLPDYWCPPDRTCPADANGLTPHPVLNVLWADFFAWMATNDSTEWGTPARQFFADSVNHANHPAGVVGYLSNQYPNSESKVMGRIQLFLDRAARWLARE